MANVTVRYNGEIMRNMLVTYAEAQRLSMQLMNKDGIEINISYIGAI